MATTEPPYARFDAPPPNRPKYVTPAALILAAGAITAMVILGSAVRDSAPPPAKPTVVTPALTPDDPAGP